MYILEYFIMPLLTSSSEFSDSLAAARSGNYLVAVISIAALADTDFSLAEHTSGLNV